jgi:hypothetical protein
VCLSPHKRGFERCTRRQEERVVLIVVASVVKTGFERCTRRQKERVVLIVVASVVNSTVAALLH